MKIKKEELEEQLGHAIDDKIFVKALKYAKQKQRYIYEQEHRHVVIQRWYLLELVKEYVKSLMLSQFTMDLYKALNDIKKERSTEEEHSKNQIMTL